MKDMVGYVPPTSLPAQPKRTLVADSKELVWNQLLSFLESSAFEIDHVDQTQNLLVARYSGNPEPYIDCGSIVTHQGGTLGQIAGSAQAVALNYELEKEPVVLNRTLNLDSRIIIQLTSQPQGTLITTDTTYVVTKTVDLTDESGAVTEGNRETVNFGAGGREEFSKGTVCQPNGSLDIAVLQSLPNIIGSNEIDSAALQADSPPATDDQAPLEEETVAAIPLPEPPEEATGTVGAPDSQADGASLDTDGLDAAAVPSPTTTIERTTDLPESDWVLPEQGLPKAALPTPGRVTPRLEAANDEQAIAAIEAPAATTPDAEISNQAPPATKDLDGTTELAATTPSTDSTSAQSPTTIVDDTTRKLLASLDCGGEEWHFCNLVELTAPYRKRNIERLFGLTINTTESFTSQVVGKNLKLDVLFPSFPAYLHIAYARRDGTVDHVMSSPEVWPADLAHQFEQDGQTIPGPNGLAMIIAIASDEPLFSSAPADAEDARAYLDRLKQRLAELEAASPNRSVAASQLLIYVDDNAS